MDSIQLELLNAVAGLHEVPQGAYSLRINGEAVGKNSTENIDIVKKECGPRQRITTNAVPSVGTMNHGFESFPVMVDVGGATIFVINVEQYVKI